jgi:hypothetical protein
VMQSPPTRTNQKNVLTNLATAIDAIAVDSRDVSTILPQTRLLTEVGFVLLA